MKYYQKLISEIDSKMEGKRLLLDGSDLSFYEDLFRILQNDSFRHASTEYEVLLIDKKCVPWIL